MGDDVEIFRTYMRPKVVKISWRYWKNACLLEKRSSAARAAGFNMKALTLKQINVASSPMQPVAIGLLAAIHDFSEERIYNILKLTSVLAVTTCHQVTYPYRVEKAALSVHKI